MKRTPSIALAVALLFPATRAAHSADAVQGLRFPVVDTRRERVTGPAYVADRLELRVAREAAGALTARGVHAMAARRPHLEQLGLAAVDRVAGDLGAWFEPEFAGETPPAAGSNAPDFTTFYIVHLPPGADLVSALARFRSAPGIASADPIAVLPISAVPNDSLWSVSYWFDQFTGHDIHAPAAWDVTTGDSSIVVAILDTGILPYHPDLGGTTAGLAGQIWTNWAEQGGVAGVDDDGNGYVDDTWGWDFVANQPVATGEDGRDEDNDPNDFAGHGTIVAGLVGAQTNNLIGVSGTAWNVRLMAVRIGWSDFGFPLGLVDMSYVAQGIRYATRNGASVINCSFATLNQSGLYAAVDDAVSHGVTIVAASGNGGQPHELADREDVIAVAATDANDVVAGFSNLGSFVDLCAPGVQISSTFVAHLAADSIGQRQPTYVANESGTSFAAPFVTGAVALLQAHQKQIGAAPLPPMGALLRLRETADDISAENFGAAGFGTGRLNLYRALTDPPGSRVSRGGATTVGAPVVLPGTSGNARLAYIAGVSLVVVDAVKGDTLVSVRIPNGRANQLAGADLGGGRGVGLFVSGTKGYVYGYDENGALLPGWPNLGASVFVPFNAGPAIGDLDGDGKPEIVCGHSTGNLYAWHADGSPVAGFPVLLDPNGINLPVALAPLDASPGAEIVAVTVAGDIHVLGGDGNELPGWPQYTTGVSVAPIVVGLGLRKLPTIIVAEGTQLHAYAADGSVRWTATLPGSALQDPAAADLDRDGSDEILVPTFAPATLAVYDSAGVPWTSHGFPVSLPAVPDGPVVVGPLQAGGAPAALLMSGGALMAFTENAAALQRFPEPGGAGKYPEIAELEADGQTEIAAGSGVDSLLYIYSAGPVTWAALASTWPAPRANDARTGTTLYAPGIAPRDDIPPATIRNLAAYWVPSDSIAVTWTAPGGDGAVGRAASYELRVSPDSSNVTNFALGYRTDLPAPDTSGTPQRFAFATAVAPGARLFFALRSRDAVGNIAAPSNVAALTTPGVAPLVVTSLAVSSIGDSSVTLRWIAPDETWKYDVRGGPSPVDTILFDSAPLRQMFPAAGTVVDTARVRPLEPGSTWWFALRPIGLTGAHGPISNTIQVTIPVGGALRGRTGVALAARGNPARVPAVFDWQGGSAGVQSGIVIYDLSGRRIRKLPLPGGRFGGSVQWNGRDDDQRAVPAGLYFARLTCGSVHAQARVVLLP